jgi:hypothetical protein
VKRLAVVLLALAGLCAGQSPQQHGAHCVFYRESAISGKGLHASIRVDSDDPIHKLPSGRYWETELPSGEHRIYADLERYGRTYKLDAGQTYYFRVEFRMNPPTVFGKYRFQIVPIETAVATSEMSPLKADKP